MPVKHFLVANRARKAAKSLPKHIQRRFLQVSHELEDNPLLGKKLHGELDSYFKYRLGDYRIIYTFNAKVSQLEIVKIEHRQGVYK